MNSVIAVRPILRASNYEAVTLFLRDHLDLSLTELDRAAGRARFSVGGGGLLVASSGEACVELSVVSLSRALERCEAGGAAPVGETQEVEGGRAVDLRLPGGAVVRLFERETADASSAPSLQHGPLHFTVGRTVARPAAELFEALTRAESLSQTFLHRASADLDVVGELEWWWTDRASSRLEVTEVEAGAGVSFNWRGHHVDYRTSVRLAVQSAGEWKARASLTESGWQADERGRSSAFAHAEGWTELLAATEALLLHGVSLKPQRG